MFLLIFKWAIHILDCLMLDLLQLHPFLKISVDVGVGKTKPKVHCNPAALSRCSYEAAGHKPGLDFLSIPFACMYTAWKSKGLCVGHWDGNIALSSCRTSLPVTGQKLCTEYAAPQGCLPHPVWPTFS